MFVDVGTGRFRHRVHEHFQQPRLAEFGDLGGNEGLRTEQCLVAEYCVSKW